METTQLFAQEKISKILFKMAPPVMLAQLIQALYNIVDSLFVGRYSDSGLTALSPIQLLMIALAVGTGVGINTVMAAKLGVGRKKIAEEYAGMGTPLAVSIWFLFAVIGYEIMPFYARMSTDSPEVIADIILYGRIVCVFSFSLFLERTWTKVLQAEGNMQTPIQIGRIGFRFWGISFLPMVTSLIFPVFFQAVGSSLKSSLLTVIRTVVLFVPLGFLFSRLGLNWFWMTFPVTETLTTLVGLWYYHQFLEHTYTKNEKKQPAKQVVIKPSHPGVIVTIAREHGSSGKQIGKLVAEKLEIPLLLQGDDRSDSSGERNIHRSDEARGAYYRNISGNEWGL